MMAPLRRMRWVTLLLLIASPAIGGQVLPLLHPCEVQVERILEGDQAVQAAAHDHAGHSGATPAPTESHSEHGDQGCQCIGACHTPAVLAAPASAELAVLAVLPPELRRASGLEADAPPASIILDRLPPSTAPPLG
jgi:hypothetical protein